MGWRAREAQKESKRIRFEGGRRWVGGWALLDLSRVKGELGRYVDSLAER